MPRIYPNFRSLLPSAGILVLPVALSNAADTQLHVNPLLNSLPTVQLELQTDAQAKHRWTIQSSVDLQAWLNLSTVITENGVDQVIQDSVDTSATGTFFRAILDESVETILNLPASPYNYEDINLPNHLRENQVRNEDNTPANNPVTNAGSALGRVLFYDPSLSRNNTISCSSCHLQENGFSDPEPFSIGFEGGLTGRNSMGLTNATFYEPGHFFWDGRADTLEEQTLIPIQDSVEMGMDLDTLVERLSEYAYYDELFTLAFGDSEVTADRLSLALSQFVRSMISYRSKYDEGEATNFANFTQQENRGRQLFNSNQTDCSDCHEGPNFVGDEPENNGLEFPFIDLGVGGVNGNRNDEGKFKMSSLRNIALTAPYMYDGRFATLGEVIDHYSTGVVANPNLGNQLENNGRPQRPNFSPEQKADLIAFLNTLTDEVFISDPKFSDPFRSTE